MGIDHSDDGRHRHHRLDCIATFLEDGAPGFRRQFMGRSNSDAGELRCLDHGEGFLEFSWAGGMRVQAG